MQPLIEVCEKIEEAAKEDVVKIVESTPETSPPVESKTNEDISTNVPQKAKSEELKYESKTIGGSSIEVRIKIKQPEKTDKDEG